MDLWLCVDFSNKIHVLLRYKILTTTFASSAWKSRPELKRKLLHLTASRTQYFFGLISETTNGYDREWAENVGPFLRHETFAFSSNETFPSKKRFFLKKKERKSYAPINTSSNLLTVEISHGYFSYFSRYIFHNT